MSTPEMMREVVIGGRPYRTDLPLGVDPFHADPPADPHRGLLTNTIQERLASLLVPHRLDSVPPGCYTVGPDKYNCLTLAIAEDGDGNRRIMRPTVNQPSPTKMSLLPRFGFVGVKEGRRLRCPTSETFRRLAELAGIDVEFFPEEGLLPPDKFLDAFSQSLFPISTRDFRLFVHDMRDHTPGIDLGGLLQREALARAARLALCGSDRDKGRAVSLIDDATVYLPDATLTSYNQYNRSNPYWRAMRALGCDRDTIAEIMDSARAKAVELGIAKNEEPKNRRTLFARLSG